MRTFKVYSVRSFPMYNTVLTVVAMTTPGLLYVLTGSFVPFDPFHPRCLPPTPASGNPQSVPALYELISFYLFRSHR